MVYFVAIISIHLYGQVFPYPSYIAGVYSFFLAIYNAAYHYRTMFGLHNGDRHHFNFGNLCRDSNIAINNRSRI